MWCPEDYAYGSKKQQTLGRESIRNVKIAQIGERNEAGASNRKIPHTAKQSATASSQHCGPTAAVHGTYAIVPSCPRGPHRLDVVRRIDIKPLLKPLKQRTRQAGGGWPAILQRWLIQAITQSRRDARRYPSSAPRRLLRLLQRRISCLYPGYQAGISCNFRAYSLRRRSAGNSAQHLLQVCSSAQTFRCT